MDLINNNQLNNSKKNRIKYIDIAKGISILCIILGHMNIPLINSILFSFHVPIFFIISGYFIEYKKENKKLIKSMWKSLIVPYIATSIILLLNIVTKQILKGKFETIFPKTMELILSTLYGSGSRSSYFFDIRPIGAIWFLLALFWAKLFFNNIINCKFKFLYILVSFTIGFISAKLIWLPFSVQSALVAVLFIYIGYLVKKCNLFSYLNLKNIFITFLIWLFVLYINFKFYNYETMSLVKCKFTFIPLNLVGAISGSLFVIGVSKYIAKIKIASDILGFLGRNSLIILCFHLIELNTISFNKIIYVILKNNYPKFMLNFAIKVLWAVLGIFLCKHIKIMKKFFNYK